MAAAGRNGLGRRPDPLLRLPDGGSEEMPLPVPPRPLEDPPMLDPGTCSDLPEDPPIPELPRDHGSADAALIPPLDDLTINPELGVAELLPPEVPQGSRLEYAPAPRLLDDVWCPPPPR